MFLRFLSDGGAGLVARWVSAASVMRRRGLEGQEEQERSVPAVGSWRLTFLSMPVHGVLVLHVTPAVAAEVASMLLHKRLSSLGLSGGPARDACHNHAERNANDTAPGKRL